MSEKNKAIARRILDEAWSQGKLDVIDELVDPDFVFHDPMAPGIKGTAGL